MRILSTGDWHFNAGYDEDIRSSVDQIQEYLSRFPVDLIALTGDIYERASEPASRNLAARCIEELAFYAEIIVVRGNHDAPGDLAILEKLKTVHRLNVDEQPEVRYRSSGMKEFKDVCLITLPWMTKARWLSLHPQASQEDADRTVSQLLLDYIKGVVVLNPGYRHVVIGHLTIAGARAGNHQQLGADGVTLGLYDLKEAGVYAALLGHIHLRQDVGDERHFYNGSVAALNYGETPEKYFSVLNTISGEVEWIRLKTVHRQDVEAYWTPVGIEASCDNSLLRGARVRVNLRVVGGDNLKAAREAIDRWMDQVQPLEYQINPQVVTVAQVRAVEISKAERLSDKLKQWWIATESDLTQDTQTDMLDKLAQLEEECCH